MAAFAPPINAFGRARRPVFDAGAAGGGGAVAVFVVAMAVAGGVGRWGGGVRCGMGIAGGGVRCSEDGFGGGMAGIVRPPAAPFPLTVPGRRTPITGRAIVSWDAVAGNGIARGGANTADFG